MQSCVPQDTCWPVQLWWLSRARLPPVIGGRTWEAALASLCHWAWGSSSTPAVEMSHRPGAELPAPPCPGLECARALDARILLTSCC